jgi:hypothetical protein
MRKVKSSVVYALKRFSVFDVTGRKCALYLGAVGTRHRLTTVRVTAVRARGEECEKAGGGSGGTEASGITASAVGERRSI